MLQYDLQRAADKLIKEMFELKEGENVVISCDTSSSMDVVNAVASSARAAGGRVMVATFPTPAGVGRASDPDIPVDVFAAAVCAADVWIELNHQWMIYSTPYTIAEANNKKLRYICMDDFTPDVLLRIIGSVDCKSLKNFQILAHDMHKKAKKVKATTPAGTDVEFDINPNYVFTCDYGEASVPGMHMCPGQLNIIPEFGTVNGTIVFDGSVTPPFGRIVSEPIRLTVKNSKIEKIEGGSDATVFEKWLKSFNDEGMLKMAHMAYGFNPGAQLTGNVVEDERIWGCTEWGIGFVSAEEAPPKGQNAISHSDGICLNTSVWLDGKQILKDGKIVDESLLAISPVK